MSHAAVQVELDFYCIEHSPVRPRRQEPSQQPTRKYLEELRADYTSTQRQEVAIWMQRKWPGMYAELRQRAVQGYLSCWFHMPPHSDDMTNEDDRVFRTYVQEIARFIRTTYFLSAAAITPEDLAGVRLYISWATDSDVANAARVRESVFLADGPKLI
jgi:hypothetical protein